MGLLGDFFAEKTKQIEEKRSKNMSEEQAARATSDNSFHNEASAHALARCEVAGLDESL